MGKAHSFKTGFKNVLACLFVFLIVLLFALPAQSEGNKSDDSIITNGHSSNDIKKGQRYFMGLLPKQRSHASCVSCHNLSPVDTLNWNPSAMEIAIKYSGKNFDEFYNSVTQPIGIKLSDVHKNFDLSEEDFELIKLYLDNLAHSGPATSKPTINRLIFFLFLGLLMTWALAELIFLRRIKIKIIPVIIILGSLSIQIYIVVDEGIRLGRQESYAPDQPIKFSHKVHAGENNIDCLYCHSSAEHSKSAGIPAANLCLNCHTLIREGTNSGKFEIAKVIDAVEKGDPIDWIRIHNLPDHVFFSHAVHVSSGKIDCNQCHGKVEDMHLMRQENDLSMGWCVNCHRDTDVNFKENGYYDSYIKLHNELKEGLIDTIKAEDIGANDCMKCHY